MSFDDIPEDAAETYECEICGGDITKNPNGIWQCNTCTRTPMPKMEPCGCSDPLCPDKENSQ